MPEQIGKIYRNGISYGAVNQIDDENKRVTTTYSSQKIEDEISKAIYNILPNVPVSGAVVNFETPYALPLVEHTVDIMAVQEGTGDPSPSNVRPISGWTACNVTRAGKNIFDTNLLSGTGITISDGVVSGAMSSFNSAFKFGISGLPIKQAVQTLSIQAKTDGNETTEGNGFWMGFYYSDGTTDRFIVPNNQTSYGRFSITSNGNKTISYVRISYSSGYNNIWHIKDIQLEYGSTATEYEPYTGSTYTVNLGQTVYGGTVDVVRGTGSKTKAYYDFTNKNTPWDSGAPNEAGFIRFVRTIADKATGYYLLCDKFPTQTGIVPSSPTAEAISGYTSNTSIYIAVSTSRLSGDLTTSAGRRQAFNDWIDANGLEICYELATPTEITLTPEEITTLVGVNNIWADTGDTAVTFKQSIEDYVTEQINNTLNQ